MYTLGRKVFCRLPTHLSLYTCRSRIYPRILIKRKIYAQLHTISHQSKLLTSKGFRKIFSYFGCKRLPSAYLMPIKWSFNSSCRGWVFGPNTSEKLINYTILFLGKNPDKVLPCISRKGEKVPNVFLTFLQK